MAVVVEWTRGPLVEVRFRGHLAVVDATGRMLFQVGDGHLATFWRSAAKPVQALPLITSGAADAFGLTPEHLALVAASHNGEPVHVEGVANALHRAGLDRSQLQCGVHPPFDRASAEALAAAGELPGSIHNNCSGKHTGMLAIARHLGLPEDDYLNPASAVQQVILRNVAAVCGLAPDQIAIGIDGCGVPVFGMGLTHMALAFARLADPDHMPAARPADAGRRMRDAMLAHPYLVAGRKRICTDLMKLPGARFVAKSGADGVYCVGILPAAVAASPVLQAAGAVGGVGIAVKAEDGSLEIRHNMVVEALRLLGLLSDADLKALAWYIPGTITNHAGLTVGQKRNVFALQSVTGVRIGC